ncbi:hypothetical protein [Nostoc sp.]|uniref:hypothetical protein n=1 Tax=Nostoc sp. TaxID=1180 RepID=UPI002FFC8379
MLLRSSIRWKAEIISWGLRHTNNPSSQMLALLEKTKASSIYEFIQSELKLDGVPPELIRLGIEKLLQNSPIKYKFDGCDSNQN